MLRFEHKNAELKSTKLITHIIRNKKYKKNQVLYKIPVVLNFNFSIY